MNRTDYVLQLGFNARYRVTFELEKGRVIQFVVQLEILAGDKWAPVVRFDTAHGFAHRDRYKAAGTTSHHEALSVVDYNDALTYAIREVRSNWEDWIREYQE